MTSHDDLNRALGVVEGELRGVSNRMDNIEALLERIDQRLSAIEKAEAERRGAQKFAVWIAGLFGGIVAAFGSVFFK